jgi:YHS domain-containing protein
VGTVAYLLVWGLLFMFMMRFGCGAHVMGHHRHHRNDNDMQDHTAQAVDPVCGMAVDTASAKTAAIGGRVWHFCSGACRDKFEANPQLYAAPGNIAPSGEPRHAA